MYVCMYVYTHTHIMICACIDLCNVLQPSVCKALISKSDPQLDYITLIADLEKGTQIFARWASEPIKLQTHGPYRCELQFWAWGLDFFCLVFCDLGECHCMTA
jgi:hypothetical protein